MNTTRAVLAEALEEFDNRLTRHDNRPLDSEYLTKIAPRVFEELCDRTASAYYQIPGIFWTF
jgi:hypothetical protein